MKSAASIDEFAQDGVYRRDFEKGVVLVNPSAGQVTVSLGAPLQRVEPQGGGAIDEAGATPGALNKTAVTQVDVPPKGAAILLR
jgi:hypothetical protein